MSKYEKRTIGSVYTGSFRSSVLRQFGKWTVELCRIGESLQLVITDTCITNWVNIYSRDHYTLDNDIYCPDTIKKWLHAWVQKHVDLNGTIVGY